MATSGVYSVTRTAGHLIYDTMLLCNAIEAGETPSAQNYADIIRVLNDVISQWQGPENIFTPGLKMWTRERASLTLSAKLSYSLKPSGGDLNIQVPVEIMSVLLRDTDGNDVPLDEMTLGEYEAIPNKTNTGTPAKYMYEKRLTEGVLYLDIVPSDITDTIQLLYRQPLELIENETQEFDIEPHLYRALKFNLAVDVWMMFSPGIAVPQSIVSMAGSSLALAQTFYPNNINVYFIPDSDT